MDSSAAPWRVLEDQPESDGPARADPAASAASATRRWLPLAAMGLAAVLGIAAVVVATAGSSPSLDVSGAEPLGSDDGAGRATGS